MERFDPMISSVLEQEMRQQGIQIRTGFQVIGLTKSAEGLVVHSANDEHLAAFDVVIWAVGRRPNTARLGLDAAGVNVMPNGIIPVDEYENTNVPVASWPNACSMVNRKAGWITTISRAWYLPTHPLGLSA